MKLFVVDRLIVCDPITGNQRHLSVPAYSHSWYNNAGPVLCAKDGCDHLGCHGGPFLIVLLEASHDGDDDDDDDVVMHIWARRYSSDTGAWSAPTSRCIISQYIEDRRPSLLIGDTLYFIGAYGEEYNILKYDLDKHELSVMICLCQDSFHPFSSREMTEG
jgi:hypothetical protein